MSKKVEVMKGEKYRKSSSKIKYKCQKHHSNEGYEDSNGTWNCWFCYAEDLYFNPKGTLIKEYTVKKYIVRIIDRTKRDGMIAVELFDKDKVLVGHWDQRDLSIALRKYVQTIEEIEQGAFRKNRRNRYFDAPPTEGRYRAVPIGEASYRLVHDEEE